MASPDSLSVMIVDDEPSMCESLALILRREGYDVRTARGGEQALVLFSQAPAHIVISDLKMPMMDGIELLKEIQRLEPKTLVIIMTAFATWSSAVEAMRLGAFDYLRKPFDNDQIRAILRRATHTWHLRERIPDHPTRGSVMGGRLIGASPQMQQIYEIIHRVAPTDATVLIQGESGTGKELVARALHYGSPRAHQPFIVCNCAAFTETLLESELFGHVRGAFTDAIADKKGLLEVADGGTFFLDEVAELHPHIQAEILRVIEEREVRPVGGTKSRHIDVRFISATNRVLEEEVRAGNFREDLFYRLNVIPVALPPLRERRNDIPMLAGHFLARHSMRMRKPVSRISPEAMELIMRYNWPGNVRELENTIQRAVALCKGEEIEPADLPGILNAKPLSASSPSEAFPTIPESGIDLQKKLEEMERSYILSALERTKGHLTQAAKLLGMTFRQLRYRIHKLNINIPVR